MNYEQIEKKIKELEELKREKRKQERENCKHENTVENGIISCMDCGEQW